MRFRKSIRISRNLKLNLSKSGISATLGGRGLSANLGPKGIYLNTSIPGTGLYDRKKIVSFDSPATSGSRAASAARAASGSRTSSAARAASGSTTMPRSVTLALGPDGNEIVYDQDGAQVRDAATLARIKSTASYRQARAQLAQQALEQANAETEAFVNVGRLSADVPTAAACEAALNEEAPAETFPPFPDPEPKLENVRVWLEAEAIKNVQTLAVWALERKREEYVQARLTATYAEECEAWQRRKAAYEAQQRSEAEARRADWAQRMAALRAGMSAGRDEVEARIGAWLQGLELPIDFDVDYEYDEASGTLLADMDLPELEDLPTQKLVEQATGRLKNRDKTQKELKQEYIRCVFGLGMFCASHFFCITPRLRRVLLSGYTQRRDPKTGDPQDTFIYSVVFTREPFEQPGYQEEEPARFMNRFRNRMNIGANGDMKKIVPFGEDDLEPLEA